MLLATMSVRIDPAAERMVTETALETGAHVVIVNLVRLPLYGTSLVLHGPDGAVLPHEDDRDEVRATAQRLADRGVDVELLRVFSTRPVRALSEIVHERDIGLVVIGPDARGCAAASSGAWSVRSRGPTVKCGSRRTDSVPEERVQWDDGAEGGDLQRRRRVGAVAGGANTRRRAPS